MLSASTLLLALPTSQLVLMLLSFAGMFGFAGVATWLWLRQRRTSTGAPPAATAPAPRSGPVVGPVSQLRAAPEPAEVTEFVALPGQRELDSPQAPARARLEDVEDVEDVENVEDVGAGAGDEPERTEFIPAPHSPRGGFNDEPEDRTEFVAPFGVEPNGDHTAFVPAPPAQAEREVKRTEFLQAPNFTPPSPAQSPAPEREVKRTEFIQAPSFTPPSPAPPPPSLAQPSLAQPHLAQPHLAQPHLAQPSLAQPSLAPPSFASPSPAPPPAQSYAPPIARPQTPTHAPTASATQSTGLTTELAEHFEFAVATLSAIEQGGDGQPPQFDGHLEVLASAPAEVLVAHLQSTLASPDPTGSRHAAAWLALLHHKSWAAKRALPELLATLDPNVRREALRVLASWDDPRASSLAAAGLAHSQAEPEHRREWLELFASSGWDPGDAAVDQALDAAHPGVLIAGLRLAESRAPTQVRAKVSAQLFATDLDVRIAAIETALVFGEQSAWLVCRQLARNPACPRAAELVGLLGSANELAQLAAAFDTNGSPSMLWALGLSGRPAALEPCAAALDDHELRAAAAEALTLASGREFSSSDDARSWIGNQSAARLIGGAPRSLDSIAGILAASTSLALRSAIARELRVRGSGRVLLTPELRPQAWRRQLARLAELAGQSIDLDSDFPWHG